MDTHKRSNDYNRNEGERIRRNSNRNYSSVTIWSRNDWMLKIDIILAIQSNVFNTRLIHVVFALHHLFIWSVFVLHVSLQCKRADYKTDHLQYDSQKEVSIF